jgi:hypothetical protein
MWLKFILFPASLQVLLTRGHGRRAETLLARFPTWPARAHDGWPATEASAASATT